MSNVTQSVIELSMANPYPPSFSGVGVFFYTALTGLWFMCAAAGWTLFQTGKITWKDRKFAAPFSLVMCYRYIIMCWMAVAIIRCGPELLYLLSFGEVSAQTTQMFLTAKRIADTLAPFPFFTGISFILLASDEISYALKHPMLSSQAVITNRIERLKDLLFLLGGISILSLIATFAKFYS